MNLIHQPGIDLAALDLDALLLTAPENVRYLTGYTGTNGMALLLRGREPVFFTDPRYAIQASQEVPCKTRIITRGGLLLGAAKELKRVKARRVGFETSHLTFDQYVRLSSSLDARTELAATDDLIAKKRMIKDEAELACIRESVLLNSRALDRALEKIKATTTESDIAAEIEYQMRRLGAEKPSFETIVASGPRTALPHARPGRDRLQPNALLLIDMGAFRNGYASDMTRTFHLGKAPFKARKMYHAVLDAQLAAIDAVRPGVTAEQVDRTARSVLKRHGLDAAFTHSTGHGLGLEIHEAPRLGKGDKTRLETGMAITIEPGVYIEGFGGIRIEDTVVVTATGCDILTPTTKEFVEI